MTFEDRVLAAERESFKDVSFRIRAKLCRQDCTSDPPNA
jgi:hypothetical protein